MKKHLLTFRACGALRLVLVATAFSLLFEVACGGRAQNNGDGSGNGNCAPAGNAIFAGAQPVTYSFSVLHSFAGHSVPAAPEGGHPYAGMVMDGAGNLCGTALSDGAKYFGTVCKVDPSGNETTLHDFTDGADGGYPWSLLVLDDQCNLYGTTINGGAGGYGTLFKLDTAGNLTVLHSFSGADGSAPRGGLIRDASGNIYGTTEFGGASDMGVVFRLNPDGTYTVLHSFNGTPDGSAPVGTLLRDAMGNLWGVTVNGGTSGWGTVFKVDSAGNESIIHTFTGPDGAYPLAGLVQDSAGNLYGAASAGGTQQWGIIYRIDTSGVFTILYNFPGGAAGAAPYNVVRDAAGNFYGVAAGDGDAIACPVSDGCGLVFKVDSMGNETVLHTFNGTDGAFGTELFQDAAGNLYGTTMEGGIVACDANPATFYTCGVAFKLTAHGLACRHYPEVCTFIAPQTTHGFESRSGIMHSFS